MNLNKPFSKNVFFTNVSPSNSAPANVRVLSEELFLSRLCVFAVNIFGWIYTGLLAFLFFAPATDFKKIYKNTRTTHFQKIIIKRCKKLFYIFYSFGIDLLPAIATALCRCSQSFNKNCNFIPCTCANNTSAPIAKKSGVDGSIFQQERPSEKTALCPAIFLFFVAKNAEFKTILNKFSFLKE